MRRLRFPVVMVLLLAILAGCATLPAQWSTMSPKQKSTVMWGIYSGQYEQYQADYKRFLVLPVGGPAKTALAKSLQARKEALKQAYDAIKAYDSFAETGLIPVEDLERKCLEVLGRIN